MTTWWPYFRIAAALLGTAALVRQFVQTVGNALSATTEWGSHVPTVVANFFSYFTILSNLSAVVALTLGAVWMLRTRRENTPEPRWLATLLAFSSTYMIVTGVVYNVLLRNIALVGLSEPWTNETLHVVMPLVMLVDVLVAPRRRALPWSAALGAAIFPIVWAIYTMVRANFITAPATGNAWWYPYPFLDPNGPGGWPSVVAYIVGIAVVIVGFAAAVVWVGRRRGIHVSNGRTAAPSAA
ncbi:Pr6Pr family membrane protein [uncultured Microbacterium sp.]|uniref:Pr6Pr family membrane protein n=1 Tax=uncultured Microbacterium sp. TaxID=191216 RepID=UPI0028DC5AC8|nr:Pr6Pr family membrane protein [uncultured Microbacterium sp.]